MSRVAAIGDEMRLAGYRLAGVDIYPASSADECRTAWTRLAADVGLLVLTGDACAALEPRLSERPQLLWVVTPD